MQWRQSADRLDGPPLAIEPAAARSAVLPPGALLERLERALRCLPLALDAPERQRTPRDAIACSDDLLPHATQWAFRRLAVCLEDLTMETAEHMLSATANRTVLDDVTALLDQSLLCLVDRCSSRWTYTGIPAVAQHCARRAEVRGPASAGEAATWQELHDAVQGTAKQCRTMTPVSMGAAPPRARPPQSCQHLRGGRQSISMGTPGFGKVRL